ncbi:hypothetical protein SNEBB_000128 [Seison nebaliae]|nr:hypothetical protein SNEBB_000128 [Seison nebaliae]
MNFNDSNNFFWNQSTPSQEVLASPSLDNQIKKKERKQQLGIIIGSILGILLTAGIIALIVFPIAND